MNDARHAFAHRSMVLSFAAVGASILALGACSATSSPKGTGNSTGTSSGTGASSTSSGGVSDDCTTLCATEAKVPCPKTVPSACVATCEFSKAEVTWCTPAATAATDCLAKEPASSFACNTAMQTAPKAGVCATEIAALATCWDNGPDDGGGLPDLTSACMTTCGKEATLSCANANCVAGCEAAIKPGQKCAGAYGALVTCAAKQDAASFACDTQSPPQANLKAGFCAFEWILLTGCLQQP